MAQAQLRDVLSSCERGIVTADHVDEFIEVYATALGASGMSIGPAHGFEECGRARGVPLSWVQLHQSNIRDDPSTPYLLRARSGATYRLRAAGESGRTPKSNVFLRSLGRHGLADAAITSVHNPFGDRLFIALYRDEGAPSFSEDDAQVIKLLAPHVARAFSMRSAMQAIPKDGPRTLGAARRSAAGHAWLADGEVTFCQRSVALFETRFELGPRKLRKLAETIRTEVARIEASGQPQTFRIAGVRADFASVPGRSEQILVLFYEEAAPLPRLSPLTGLLSPRQKRIAAEIVGGATLEQIAASLDLGRETVRTHVRAIARRFGTSSRHELVLRLIDG